MAIDPEWYRSIIELEELAPDDVFCVYDPSVPKYSILKIKVLMKGLGRDSSTFSDEELERCLA